MSTPPILKAVKGGTKMEQSTIMLVKQNFVDIEKIEKFLKFAYIKLLEFAY